MIWATVSYRSYFCCLYKASSSSATKNIINQIFILTIRWCPCVESSLVLLEEGVCCDECFLGKTLLAFALLHSVLQGQTCLLLQVSLNFLLFHSSPWCFKGHFFPLLVLKCVVGLHRTIQLQLLQHYWLGNRLGLPWYWMACLGNQQTSLRHFLSLHPVTEFQTLFLLLLTVKVIPFLLRDSCP